MNLFNNKTNKKKIYFKNGFKFNNRIINSTNKTQF